MQTVSNGQDSCKEWPNSMKPHCRCSMAHLNAHPNKLHDIQECSDYINEYMQSQGHNEITNQRSDTNKDKTCMHCKLDSATILLTTKGRSTSQLDFRWVSEQQSPKETGLVNKTQVRWITNATTQVSECFINADQRQLATNKIVNHTT